MKTTKAQRRALRDRTTFALATAGAAGLLVLATLLMWLMTPASDDPTRDAQVGGPFRLVADNGGLVTDRSFPGKYLVLYFGYTSCRDVCPATLTTLAAALDRLGHKSALVQPLFITVDPARDTQDVLHRYVTAVAPSLIGLGGTDAALRQVAAEYHVTVIRHPAPGGATLDHSSVLYLMAPDGRFVAPIPADASEMVMARALARYVS